MVRVLGWASSAASACACAVVLSLAACSSPPKDPMAVLTNPRSLSEQQLGAIRGLAAGQRPISKDAAREVRRLVFAPGIAIGTRQAAFDLLLEDDRAGLREALETNIVRMDSFEFRRWILDQIGARGLKDFTTVVVNSWAGAVPAWGPDERGRPEFAALAAIYGPERVSEALFAVLNEAHPTRQAGLRARTWEILIRLDERAALRDLVMKSAIRPDDAMLRDIKQLVDDLGILPETREELLWLAKLRANASPGYWKAAGEALRAIPEDRKQGFELRGVPVALAAHKHAPELLGKSREELFDDLMVRLRTRDASKYSANFTGWETGPRRTEVLGLQRDEVRWIDLVACGLALALVDDPAVRARLFDMGDRDQQDRRTEYGGVIRIDDAGNWSVVEVRPRVTGSDLKFEAPQELFDQGYTALFHFHLHAQEYENGSYAGPHMGDFGYANSTRANCLVMTFVRRDTMNVDFYRHGPLVIDLGTVKRP
jgi:hypothetical protein